MNIGVDIDGVIWDFAERLDAYALWHNIMTYKKENIENDEAVFIEEKYNWSEQEFKEFFLNNEVNISRESVIMPFCKEVLELLRKEGHKLYIITARDLKNEEMIIIAQKMLNENGIPYDQIYWKLNDKINICQQLKIDYMIEDNIRTCKKLAEANIKSIYFRNRGSKEVTDNSYIHTVSNWVEIYKYLFTILKK